MKNVFLFLLVFPLFSNAQRIEGGIGGGIGLNTQPTENLLFKGDKMTINPVVQVQAFYHFNRRLQMGIELAATELSGKSDVTVSDPAGNVTGTDTRRFIYAKAYGSLSGVFNVKAPVKNGYLYAGAALGYGVGRHDSRNLKSNEAFRTPDGGKGIVAGAQVGIVRGISRHFAVFGQAAFRFHQMNYDTPTGTGAFTDYLRYSVMSFPVTLGLRFR